MNIEILHLDEHFVAVNKPSGLLMHRSSIAADASEFLLQLVRDQLGQHIFPFHRLDRKTSGIVMFGLHAEAARKGQQMLLEDSCTKEYIAIVRGHTPPAGSIDKALENEKGQLQQCLTQYTTLDSSELPFSTGIHPSSRYALVCVHPKTGRMHQIRRHFNHLRHPIIGDRPHGCNKQNKFFLEHFKMNKMMLHARKLSAIHPYTHEKLCIEASPNSEFLRMLKELQLRLEDE